MTEFTLSRRIAAPPERVFEISTDLRHAAEHVRGITRLEVLTDGPIGVGTRFRETRIVLEREATEEMEVTAFDPPRSYTVEAESCGTHFASTFTFEPVDGGTEVRLVFRAEPRTFGAKVMGFVFRGMLKSCMRAVAQDLDDIAAVAEGRAATKA